MNLNHVKAQLQELRRRTCTPDGAGRVADYADLAAVDHAVMELRLVLGDGLEFEPLLREIERDERFNANSRRVRLEAIARYCDMALRRIASGAASQKKVIYSPPDLSPLAGVLPSLEQIISDRWLEAQKCQHAGAHLSAVIMMGSILEALLLARAHLDVETAYRSPAAPKDKTGSVRAIHDWTLSQLIEVAVHVQWLKQDRGKFSHALRESRNIVHPWAQAQQRADFDSDTCVTCWHVLRSSVSDLLKSVAK